MERRVSTRRKMGLALAFTLVATYCTCTTGSHNNLPTSFTSIPPVMDVEPPATRTMDVGKGWEGFSNDEEPCEDNECQPLKVMDYTWKVPTELDMRASKVRLFLGSGGRRMRLLDTTADLQSDVLQAGFLAYGDSTDSGPTVAERIDKLVDRISPTVRRGLGTVAGCAVAATYWHLVTARARASHADAVGFGSADCN